MSHLGSPYTCRNLVRASTCSLGEANSQKQQIANQLALCLAFTVAYNQRRVSVYTNGRMNIAPESQKASFASNAKDLALCLSYLTSACSDTAGECCGKVLRGGELLF